MQLHYLGKEVFVLKCSAIKSSIKKTTSTGVDYVNSLKMEWNHRVYT